MNVSVLEYMYIQYILVNHCDTIMAADENSAYHQMNNTF